ncbi:50S ribosomal protein L18 [Candidatus Woesearchaeota archaeon]|nr:50S ribosomal protein L18 [Candidatus Woesearchaeota archaeon]
MADEHRTIMMRRKREGRTNYKKRLKYLVSGKSRMIVRICSRSIIVQVAAFSPKGDIVSVHVNSKVLSAYGWKYSCKNLPAAYLTGLLAGTMARKKGIKEVVVDFGLKKAVHGSKLFSAVKGMVDAGVLTGGSKDNDKGVMPSDERISGSHIMEYAKALKENKELYNKNFSGYLKSKADPEAIASEFKAVKDKIAKS